MAKNIETITWSNTFACGIKIIDDQHKGLVNLVNEMYNHVTGDELQEHQYLKQIVQEAINYVKVHFATEEKIMTATKFSGYAEHKKEHDNFIRTVAKIIKEYNEGKRLTLAVFSKFLKEWILSHIAIMDKEYFDYLNKIASRKSSGKLTITSEDVALFG